MTYVDGSQDPIFERSLKVNPIARLEDRELLGHVYMLLEEIHEKKRTVFVLHELNGMDIEEISEVLSIPENTVKSRLFHARSEMLKKMKKRNIV
jgi:RNA polymerase sigma-70 factor (ECF subfamily)